MDSDKNFTFPDDDAMPDINGHETPPAEGSGRPNLLRQKTFNDDLKNILNRIRDNEGTGESPPITIQDMDSLTDEEFLVAMHSLFYRIKNADDVPGIQADSDPYDCSDLSEEAGPVPWKKALDRKMNALGFTEYALLGYDFRLRAFVPRSGSMNMEMENIAISLRDGLYRKIRSEGQGLFLESSSIEVDDWLSKLFRPTDRKNYALYFIRSGLLTSGLFSSISGSDGRDGFPLDEKILVIRFTGSADFPRQADLYARLERGIGPFLALASGKRAPVIRTLGLDDIDIQIALVEYLLAQYSSARDGLCVVISVQKSREKEILFIIKYLIAKLKKALWKYSALVQISGTCIMVLSRQADTVFVNESVSEINRYYNDVFQVDFPENGSITDPAGFIHSLFMR